MNRAAIRTRITNRMQLNPGVVSETERNEYIDNAIEDFASLGVWLRSHTQTVTASGSPVTLQSDFASPIRAYWDGVKLDQVDGSEYRVSTATGTPSRFFIAVDPTAKVFKLYLWPNNSASGTLIFEYIGQGVVPLPSLSDSTDLTTYGVPADWHSAIVLSAVMQAHDKNGDVLSAQRFERLLDRRLSRLVDVYTQRINALIKKEEPYSAETPISRDIFIDPWS